MTNKSIVTSIPFSTNDKFIIAWLDPSIDESNEDIVNNIIELENIVRCIKTFTDADQCFTYLQNVEDKKVFIILSDSFNRYLTLMQDMPQVYSMYVISNTNSKFEHSSQQYKKLKGVFNEIEGTFDTLKQDIRQCEIDLVSNDTASVNSNELDSSYIYSKLLKEIILKIKYDEEAKKTFVRYCRERYANDSSSLRMIDEFEERYQDYSPVWWYTGHSQLYSMLNSALRTVNVDMIIKMGFLIQDIHREIERLNSLANYTERIVVYRGQGISNLDFEKVKKSTGGLLLFNNFLSTSTDRGVSLCFAESNQCNPNVVGVLFQIEMDPSDPCTSFANIDRVNRFADLETSEILFSTQSVFRIDAVNKIEDRLWQVNLTLTNDIGSSSKCLIDCLRSEIEHENPLKSLAVLMNKMGHFDQALKINTQLLNAALPSSVKDYYDIGLMHQSMGDYAKALSYFEKTLENDQHDLLCAKTYNSIAGVYQSLGDCARSLSYYEKAVELEQKCLPESHPSLAVLYSNIGEVYKSIAEYSKAFAYHEKALEIQKQVLPHNHPSIAITYNNMGSVHRLTGNHSIALLLYEKTLNIELHCLQPNHPSLAFTYNNIGLQYSLLKDYPTALTHYEKALAIAEKSSSFDQSLLALLYNNFGEVYDSMENYTSALSFYEKALTIQQKFLPPNHPELAAVYNNIGEVHRSQGNYSTALTYYEKTLEIEQQMLPSNHPSLAITYTNMAVAFEGQERYEDAIKYIEQALQIVQQVFGVNHPTTRQTDDYLDELREKLVHGSEQHFS